MRAQHVKRGSDWLIARLAEAQHGVVARRQLLVLGLTREAIQVRIEGGRLLPVHRGVYAVGHRRLTQGGRWMAAVLAVGSGAVLSHRSAAALWGLVEEFGDVDVSSPRNARPWYSRLDDPANPGRMKPEWTSDGNHPSIKGYKRLADEVRLP